MTKDKPTIKFDIGTLNGLSLRLAEHADAVLARRDTAQDLQLARRCVQLLAHVRFALGELAAKTTDHDVRLEIRGLLDDIEKAEPGVGEP